MAEPAAPTTDYTTIYNLPLDILGLCHSFLGVGHFAFIAPVCKIFKQAYLSNPGHDKVTSGESITSSISCARKYLENERTGRKQKAFFWYHAARYGCLDVLEWAYQQGYASVGAWDFNVPSVAARYGQLDVLK